ncbi:response regulator [Desulfocurvus sp. DL9XJH121]
MQKTKLTPFATALAISPDRDRLRRDREALQAAGVADVRVRDSIKDGLAWLAENDVDLLLLDAELGRTTGPRVLRMLRRHREYRRLPVIVTSNDGSRAAVLRSLAAGCSGFLVRPYSVKALLRQCALAAADTDPGRERLAALRLAREEAELGRHERAISALDRAASKREEAERLYDEGCMHLAEERFEQAIAAFGKAVALNDLFAEAYIGMANAWTALERPDKARGCMRRAAEAHARASDMDRTRQALALALRDNPLAANPFLDLGFALVRQGEFKAAGQAYVLASRHGATGEDSFKAASRACLFTRDPKTAARRLSEAMAEADAALDALPVYKRIMGDIPRTPPTGHGRDRSAALGRPVNDIWAVVKFTAKAFLGGGPPPFEPLLPLDF